MRLPPLRTGLAAAGGAVLLVALVLAPVRLGGGPEPTGDVGVDARGDRDSAPGGRDRSASPKPALGAPKTTGRRADRARRGETSGHAGGEAQAGEFGGLPGLPALADPARGSRQVVTAAPRSDVAERSRSSDGERLHVALTATSPSSVAAVLRYYRIRLGRLAFAERPVHAFAGSTAAAFRRGADTVTVTVTPRAGGVDYSVFGSLSPRGS